MSLPYHTLRFYLAGKTCITRAKQTISPILLDQTNTDLFQHVHLQGLNIPSEILHEFEDGIIVDNTK